MGCGDESSSGKEKEVGAVNQETGKMVLSVTVFLSLELFCTSLLVYFM